MTFIPNPTGSRPGCLGLLAGGLMLSAFSAAVASVTVWFDDAIPAGAWTGAEGGDSWNWIGSNPGPQTGTLAHQSNLVAGIHHHYFSEAAAMLAVSPGDTLFAWVQLDAANPPREIMLGWFDGTSWSHLAYWGENLIPWGTDGTADQRPMGGLPETGKWVRLEVPASAVDLEGRTLSGMGFVAFDGRVTWDLAGKFATDASDPPPASTLDEFSLLVPPVGDHGLRILSPTLLELVRVNTKAPDPGRVDSWDWIDDRGNFAPQDLSSIRVTVDGQARPISRVGFKRRPLFASPDAFDPRIGNLNFEGGCNPVNVTYVTGLGWKRQRLIVDQYSANDRRTMPKDGVPISNIQEGFTWTWLYGSELTALCFPADGAETAPWPFYDRWSDFWNVTTEASTTNSTRCFAVAAWLAAQTPLANQSFRSIAATITAPANATRGQPVTVTLQVADPNLDGAKIVWEAIDHEPAFGGLSHTFTPMRDGANWIEAEVQWPDGRRAFAAASVTVTPPN